MNDWFPFLVPACGLVFLVTGVLMLLVGIVATRAGRSDSTAAPTEDEVAAMTQRLRSSFARTRLFERVGGPFWFLVGLLTLWFSELRAPYILPAVGLFWMLGGAMAMLRPHGRQQTDDDAVSAALAAWDPAVRRRLGRQQCVWGTLFLCVGIPLLWFSGLCVGTTPVAVSPVAVSPVAVSPVAEDENRLAEIIRQQVEPVIGRQGQVGLVVGAIAGDEEVLLGFGSRRLGDFNPPDADTLFEIGSISKVFTGVLLAGRIESGELELDTRVAELLPKGWDLSEAAREITLRHCTTHTSGLPRLPENLSGFSGAIRSLFGGDPYRDYGEQAFREALATTDVEFEPGTRCLYSNFAAGLLGFVLASHGQTDYETLVTSEICGPLGMHDTVLAGDQSRPADESVGYRATLALGPAMIAMTSAQWRLPNHLAGAGGIRSTGRDMLSFLKANMGRLPTELDAAIQRSHQELFRAEMRMGMNWIHSFKSGLPRRVIWHNGGTGGFRSYLGFTDDRQFGVFVLSNTTSDVDALAVDILKAIDQEFAWDGQNR